jgi:NADPH:quinone reductase-like Zn-dependent oxidoreductase
MHIFGFDSYGGPDVAGVLDVPAPVPVDGSVLIETVVTTVNPADIKVRNGDRQGKFPVTFPMAMGREAAGRVITSTDPAFRPGDVVFGGTLAGTGSFAPRVLLDASQTAAVPVGVPAAEGGVRPGGRGHRMGHPPRTARRRTARRRAVSWSSVPAAGSGTARCSSPATSAIR